jgi:hypothetical protein
MALIIAFDYAILHIKFIVSYFNETFRKTFGDFFDEIRFRFVLRTECCRQEVGRLSTWACSLEGGSSDGQRPSGLSPWSLESDLPRDVGNKPDTGNNSRLLCMFWNVEGEVRVVTETEFDSQRQRGTSVTGDCRVTRTELRSLELPSTDYNFQFRVLPV